MSEKRFLNFICVEGILLTVLALCVLILPKLTSMSFGVMLSVAFITYGLYKIITSFINRSYMSNILWTIFLGAYILTIGILYLLVPQINILWLIALTGVFFLLESISAVVFISKMHTVFNSLSCKCFAAIILFLIGLTIVLGLPLMQFWLVVILSGIALLIKGMAKIAIALSNKNNYI